jgi:hypothetical protein
MGCKSTRLHYLNAVCAYTTLRLYHSLLFAYSVCGAIAVALWLIQKLMRHIVCTIRSIVPVSGKSAESVTTYSPGGGYSKVRIDDDPRGREAAAHDSCSRRTSVLGHGLVTRMHTYVDLYTTPVDQIGHAIPVV